MCWRRLDEDDHGNAVELGVLPHKNHYHQSPETMFFFFFFFTFHHLPAMHVVELRLPYRDMAASQLGSQVL